MPKKLINISLERNLWDDLSKFAWDQSLITGKRFPTIRALRLAVKVFLRASPQEINEILNRTLNTHNMG
jgi:hypothetical protein